MLPCLPQNELGTAEGKGEKDVQEVYNFAKGNKKNSHKKFYEREAKGNP